MTLQQLTYLVTVADCGNITEAAEKLFISQPSLSAAIHNLEKERYHHRITRSIIVNQLGQLWNIHTSMVVILVFCEHSGNIMHVKTHIDFKGRGYIPRAVMLMLCIWSDFLTKISNVMNTCQNDRLEGWTFVANQIISSELRQKVQKHLIIAGTVYLIDHQHNLLIIQFADNTKLTEQLHQICNRGGIIL